MIRRHVSLNQEPKQDLYVIQKEVRTKFVEVRTRFYEPVLSPKCLEYIDKYIYIYIYLY
jgi:hypothetical protein